MKPARYDIVVYKGADLVRSMVWKDSGGSPVDLTGGTALMQFRADWESTDPLVDVSSSVTLGGTAGTIGINVAGTATANYAWQEGVYDLKITLSSSVVRVLEGRVTVRPAASR